MNSPIFFCDLDQTMIFSKRIVRTHNESRYNGLVVVESHHGDPTAFMTLKAAETLQVLEKELFFVPCSTRSVEQYSRVQLPGRVPSLTILDNGAKILRDGVEDERWSQHVRDQVLKTSADPAMVYSLINHLFKHESWFERIKTNDGFFISVLSSAVPPPKIFIDWVKSHLEEWNYNFSVQSRSIYLIPNAVSKEYAAAAVAAEVSASKVYAAGDSVLDLNMMLAADSAIRPAHGELYEKGLGESIIVTSNSGPKAGEQILDFVISDL